MPVVSLFVLLSQTNIMADTLIANILILVNKSTCIVGNKNLDVKIAKRGGRSLEN